MTLFHPLQVKAVLPLLVALLHISSASAKSVNQKQPLRMPGLASGKHNLLKHIMTSQDKPAHTMTSRLASQALMLQNATLQRSTTRNSTSDSIPAVTSHGMTTDDQSDSKPAVTSQGISTDDQSETATSLLTSEEGSGTEMATSRLTSGQSKGANMTSALTSQNEEDEKTMIEPIKVKVVDENCAGNKCGPGSRCDASEGLVADTGLLYVCRCPPRYYGIFCTIPEAEACKSCSASNLYCLKTSMHWSGHFCYNKTNGWERIGTAECGRYDFPCDGGNTCVPPSHLCDGVATCRDEKDEHTHCSVVDGA